MKRELTRLSVLFCLVLMMQACKKEGPPGPAGANGTNGKDGNANVVSGTVTITNTDYKNDIWSYQTGPGSASGISAKMALVSIPAITDDIFKTGTVLVYAKMPAVFGGSPITWAALPWQISSFNPGYLIILNYTYEAGKLRIYYMYQPTDHTVAIPTITAATVPTFDFKYVIIAGNKVGRGPIIDYTDYEAVKAYYHLPD